MKKQTRRIIEYLSWLPAVAVMAMIFVLSSQNGSASKDTSSSVVLLLADKTRLEVDFNDISKLENFDVWNQWIRTLAHMAEYAAFALMVGFAVSVNGFRGKMRFIYMCILGFALSFLDEFYQIFVPDRYGDLIDIVFDSVSVIAVALFVYLIDLLWERKKRRKTAAGESRDRSLEDGKESPVQNADVSAENGFRRPFMSSYIDSITLQEVLDLFRTWIKEKGGFHYIVTPNADHMVMLEKDEELRRIYQDADLILTDGQPLMWIAESLGSPIAEKIPGSDLLPEVCQISADLQASLFLLGTTEEIACSAAEKLKNKYPGLSIAGTYSPDMGFERNRKQQKLAINKINDSKADILVLALGSPKQEKFIYANRDRLKVNLALPIGAAIDFAAGAVKRAPVWMRKAGLEWLYRFIQEPGRLFRRYFVDDMKIFYLAWKYRHQIRGLE